MSMRKNLQDIYMMLTTDETLLRLLYYKPSNAVDNPLDPAKTNILSMAPLDKWNIISDRIKTTSTVDSLDTTEKCRVCFYSGRRISARDNYMASDQEIIFDIYAHFSFDEVDLRLSWISDRINDLLFNNKITGTRKIFFKAGIPKDSPTGYSGFRLVYLVGNIN